MDIAEFHQPAAGHTAKVLHIGCGAYGREKLPPIFRQAEWQEFRLDIDPDVAPDVVASITDMHVIPDGTVDALYSAHNIEHLYPHEVAIALQEMLRVLKPNGFALIKVPDLQEVARHIADGKLDEPLYMSPMGAITPLDILYGHRPSLAAGNAFMAHHTGFTNNTLAAALIKAGFAAVVIERDALRFGLTAIAFCAMPDEQELTTARVCILATIGQPAVFYTAPV